MWQAGSYRAVLLEPSFPNPPNALLPAFLLPTTLHRSLSLQEKVSPPPSRDSLPGSARCVPTAWHLLLPWCLPPGLHLCPPNPPPVHNSVCLQAMGQVSFRDLQVSGMQITRDGSDLRGGAQGVCNGVFLGKGPYLSLLLHILPS